MSLRRVLIVGLQSFALLVALSVRERPAYAYVEAAYSLGRLVTESTNILLVRCEKVDKERRLIIYRKVADIKGVHPGEVIKHQITDGFNPREPKFVMSSIEPGKLAIFCHNGSRKTTSS